MASKPMLSQPIRLCPKVSNRWCFNSITDCILVALSFPWINLRLEHLEACSMIRTGVDCPAVLDTMPRGIPSQQLGKL